MPREYSINKEHGLEIMKSLVAGLVAQYELYNLNHGNMTAMTKKAAKVESKRAMNKIQYMNGMLHVYTDSEIKIFRGKVIR
ncbi:MAG: hypothetical protein ABS894_00855 [Aerococcus urinaeequi]